MGMSARNGRRALARAVASEREKRLFHQGRLALQDRLVGIEAGDSLKKVRS